ncbi:MAG: nucleotidyltransferase domain-containing protein [Gammaproteobacteria bacterium]|nr:nucleotidyltransferase domain-containing protein [Gammaproteobacteria bacterium]
MRLTSLQITAILSVLDPLLSNKNAELRLYGSRTNDTLKGGDIDLLLLLDDPESLEELNKNKHYLLAHIKNKIGDQKIDFLFSLKENIKIDAFLKIIYPESIALKIWSS